MTIGGLAGATIATQIVTVGEMAERDGYRFDGVYEYTKEFLGYLLCFDIFRYKIESGVVVTINFVFFMTMTLCSLANWVACEGLIILSAISMISAVRGIGKILPQVTASEVIQNQSV